MSNHIVYPLNTIRSHVFINGLVCSVKTQLNGILAGYE
jgi:hypothetical protein